jgi:hypothetical protein
VRPQNDLNAWILICLLSLAACTSYSTSGDNSEQARSSKSDVQRAEEAMQLAMDDAIKSCRSSPGFAVGMSGEPVATACSSGFVSVRLAAARVSFLLLTVPEHDVSLGPEIYERATPKLSKLYPLGGKTDLQPIKYWLLDGKTGDEGDLENRAVLKSNAARYQRARSLAENCDKDTQSTECTPDWRVLGEADLLNSFPIENLEFPSPLLSREVIRDYRFQYLWRTSLAAHYDTATDL